MLNRNLARLSPILLICSAFAGNFAHIEDPDGFVNIRVSPSRTADVIDKVKQRQCVETFATFDGWTHVAYAHDQETITGYIRGSRLIPDSQCQIQSVEKRHGKCAVASILAEELGSVNDMVSWTKQFPKCREAEILATVAEKTTQMLVQNWDSQVQALAASQSEPGFLPFFLAQIEASTSVRELTALTAKSSACNDKKYSELCKKILTAADKALDR